MKTNELQNEILGAKESKAPKEPKDLKDKKAVSTIKKIDPEAARLLAGLREKANKKDFGRSVRDSEIIFAGLKLITQAQLEELQQATFSEQDRLKMAHAEYSKKHGKITLDQFIGKLLKGAMNLTQAPKA